MPEPDQIPAANNVQGKDLATASAVQYNSDILAELSQVNDKLFSSLLEPVNKSGKSLLPSFFGPPDNTLNIEKIKPTYEEESENEAKIAKIIKVLAISAGIEASVAQKILQTSFELYEYLPNGSSEHQHNAKLAEYLFNQFETKIATKDLQKLENYSQEKQKYMQQANAQMIANADKYDAILLQQDELQQKISINNEVIASLSKYCVSVPRASAPINPEIVKALSSPRLRPKTTHDKGALVQMEIIIMATIIAENMHQGLDIKTARAHLSRQIVENYQLENEALLQELQENQKQLAKRQQELRTNNPEGREILVNLLNQKQDNVPANQRVLRNRKILAGIVSLMVGGAVAILLVEVTTIALPLIIAAGIGTMLVTGGALNKSVDQAHHKYSLMQRLNMRRKLSTEQTDARKATKQKKQEKSKNMPTLEDVLQESEAQGSKTEISQEKSLKTFEDYLTPDSNLPKKVKPAAKSRNGGGPQM